MKRKPKALGIRLVLITITPPNSNGQGNNKSALQQCMPSAAASLDFTASMAFQRRPALQTRDVPNADDRSFSQLYAALQGLPLECGKKSPPTT